MQNTVCSGHDGNNSTLTSRHIFLRAAKCEVVARPPIWMMRQAGRSLPEYLELKGARSFTELAQTPELAAEATLLPIRRFGYDAAVIFSDILVIPEAMGQAYRVREQGGIAMDFAIETAEDVDKLTPDTIEEKLTYTPDAIRLVRDDLGDSTAILGFCGSPWTLACFMTEGGSAKEYRRARRLFYDYPRVFEALMEKLTEGCITYLKMQIEAGADAIQIFDSLGGVLAKNAYMPASGKWIRRIVKSIKPLAPVIVFPRGVHGKWEELSTIGADVLSVDWTVSLREVADMIPSDMAVQGNLDPSLLEVSPDTAERETLALLESMRDRDGFIFNLGHGVNPVARLDTIERVTQTVKDFRWAN